MLQGDKSGSALALMAPLAVQLHAAVDAAESADATAQQAAEGTLQLQRTRDEHLVQVLRAQASHMQSQLEEAQVGREGVKSGPSCIAQSAHFDAHMLAASI